MSAPHAALRRDLLSWFRRHQRDLPWRRSREPYHIWVSEIMLQQTQVAAVVPYFQRFLNAFPTVRDLAEADEQQVLRLWEGLGYYRRARSLHQAAQVIVREHGGELPSVAEELHKLPGIGRYSLGAILSQAFDQRWPAVDANAARVLARWFAWTEPIGSSRSQSWLWETAEQLVPRTQPGEFNQALMELGSQICTARSPHCGACPVSRHCLAFQESNVASIPCKSSKAPTENQHEVAIIVQHGKRVLVRPRGSDAVRWAGMWSFVHGARLNGESSTNAAERLLQELVPRARLGPVLTTIHYNVTRFQIAMDCFTARTRSSKLSSAAARWLLPGDLHDLPLPQPQRRLAQVFIRRLGE